MYFMNLAKLIKTEISRSHIDPNKICHHTFPTKSVCMKLIQHLTHTDLN